MANAKSTNKVATKKAPTKKAAPQVKPVEEFRGYKANTSSYDDNDVTFGCGAVTVPRKDLRSLADLYQNSKTIKPALAVLSQLESYEGSGDGKIKISDFLDMGKKDRNAIAAAIEDGSLDKFRKITEDWFDDVVENDGIEGFTQATPAILRGLAAVPEDDKC